MAGALRGTVSAHEELRRSPAARVTCIRDAPVDGSAR
jgi:hypothetical protein